MDELETLATEATAADSDNWDDIDLSNVDITADDKDEEIGAEQPNAEEPAPETDEADQQTQTDGDIADKEETETEQTKETDQFTLKHLDEVKTVSRDEVIALAQKGMDYDRAKQKAEERYTALEAEKVKADDILSEYDTFAKESGFESANEMLDDIRAEILAKEKGYPKEIALEKIQLDRQKKEIAAKEAKQNAEKNSADEAVKLAEEKRQKDFRDFVTEYPKVNPKDIPEEVWDKVRKGDSLVLAYTKFENAELKAKQAAEAKAKENAARSTGSRASVGKPNSLDEFDKLWYSD